jgi:acetyl-CoA carboxylase alpha subunit
MEVPTIMKKAPDVKKVADEFNQPEAKAARLKDLVSHIVDTLLEDSVVAAKRGQYDMSYKMDDMVKERMRLANLQEEEVNNNVIIKMKELGFETSFNRPYINVSWR